jgi:putative membrane protein
MIDAMTAGTFTRHMVAHTALVALIAPLVAAVIARSRLNPVAWRPQWFSPIAASLIEFVVIWGWHAPALHVFARHDRGALALEQVSFLGASTYLWLAILGGGRASSAMRAGTGIIALVLTFAHMTMLGAVLALAPRDLYGHGAESLADQQLGGAVMIAAGTVVYLGAALWLSRSLLIARAHGGPP